MENLTLDLEELFSEAKDQATAEGAYSREEWDEIVEGVLEQKREFEEIDPDEDLVAIEESLKARFDDFRAELPEV